MTSKFKHIVLQLLFTLLIIQTVNLSFISIGFYNQLQGHAEPVDADYVDSMLEFVVENVCGFSKDTIRDKANPDNAAKQQTLVHIDIKWIPYERENLLNSEPIHIVATVVPQNEMFINQYFKEVPVKPPQFI